jgi:hypothetical protein
MPPLKILRKIIELAPKTAKIQDDEGQLLHHCACRRSNNSENLQALLEAYPMAIEGQDNMGNLPRHHSSEKFLQHHKDDTQKIPLSSENDL